MEVIRIPAERVSVLIGQNGETKKLIEEKCKITLQVDAEGEVQMDGEPADVFLSRSVVQAIGRGFSPRIALKLIDEDHSLLVFPLRELLSSEKAIKRIKGRVIGEDGRMKEEIENATDSYLSIYGHTVAVISRFDTLPYAREAIEMLLNGAPHAAVYNYLGKARRQIMESRLKG